MTDLADYSRLLPDDLSLGERLQSSGVYGDVFRVEQASSSSIPLVIRFISTKDIADEYRGTLAQRLELLSRGALPHLSHIVRYGWQDDLLWLVTDQYASRLWNELRPHEPAAVTDAERIFLQIMAGLETLHELGIPHGDMRSKNVFLATAGEQEIAWVGDAAIGCFSWWTGSKLLENDSLRYAIPGQEASTAGKPSFNQDLYALGLVGCELLLGHAFDRTSLDVIDKQLKEAKASQSLRLLIVLLLRRGAAKEPCRCGDLRTMWQDQLARQRQRSTNLMRLSAVVLLLGIISLIWSQSTTQSMNVSLASKLREQIDAQRTLVKKIEELEEIVKQPRPSPPPQPSPSPATNDQPSEAQQRWNDVVEKATESSGNKPPTASALWKAYTELKSSEDPKISKFPKEADAWATLLRERILNEFYRTNRDKDLTQRLNDFARKPWDNVAQKKVDDRIEALAQAKDNWQDWANKSLPWERVMSLLALTKESAKKEILSDWLRELNSREDWNIRLISGDAAPGNDVYRVVRIYVDGYQQGPRYNNTWKEETHHDYDPRNGSNTMPFTWKPDQTFGISLEQNGYAYNGNMIVTDYKHPFDGALAIWKAYNQGETRQDTSVLKFQILDCPGPPSQYEVDTSSNPTKSP